MQILEAAGSDFFVSSQRSEHRESTILSGFKDFIQVGKAVLVVRPGPRVKADDMVVAFHIFPPLVLPIAEICPHTGNGKILPAAVQRGQPVVLAGDKPAGEIRTG